jgi:hypothetical protein
MTELSDKVLKLTSSYIGPASQKFLERQTVSHMNGLQFNALEQKHLSELAKWVKVSASLLIALPKAQDLANKILTLA